jgi:hypothetical protein
MFLDFVQCSSFCCSWSAGVLELMTLTSAGVRHLARDVEPSTGDTFRARVQNPSASEVDECARQQ